MTILASTIIAQVSEILQDEDNTRWLAENLLDWLNAGIRDAVTLKPSAYVRNESMPLVAGTKQSIPSGGITFMDVTRNMGADGATPGRVPRFIEKKIIDAENPNWHTDPASATVMHYTFDERDPKHFYVHPKQPSVNPGRVEVVFSAVPAAITDSQALPLDDIYANALIDYLLYRSYAKDPVNASKAAGYYQSFVAVVTGKKIVDADAIPSADKEG